MPRYPYRPSTVGLLIDRLLAEPNTALLTLNVRSNFGSDRQRNSNVRTSIEHLIDHPFAPHFEFMTPSAFVRRLETAKSL